MMAFHNLKLLKKTGSNENQNTKENIFLEKKIQMQKKKLVPQRTGVIIGALNFKSTEHGSKTLPLALE